MSTVTAPRSSILKSDSLHFLIALGMCLLLLTVLQPQEGLLTDLGVRAVAIIIPTIYLWITINTNWVCLLFFALLVISGVMAPMAVWAGTLGHFSVMMILVYTIICMCLSYNGVIDKVAVWFITRPFVKGRPYAVLTMYFFSMLALGLFTPNMPITILYINFTIRICEKIGIQKGHSLYTMLFLGVLWSSCILSASAPISFGIILIGILHPLGIYVTMLQWLLAGMVFTAIGIVFIMLAVRIANPDVSPLKKLDIEELARETPPLDRGGKIAGITMVVLLLFIMVPELFRIFGVFYAQATWIVGLSPQVLGILALSFLCLVKNKGEPILDFLKTARDVPMSLLLFVAAVNIMSNPISNPYTGILPWMNNAISPLVAGLSPTTVMMILLILAVIQTSFMSNMVTIVMYFNLGLALFYGTDMNIAAFGILIAFAANFSFLTPAATITTPMFFGPEHITMGNSIKPNLVFMVFSFIMLFILVAIVPSIVPV